MSEHAFLSASGSDIWLNCTPAMRAAEGKPDQSSIFAEEGTFAHEVAAYAVMRQKDVIELWPGYGSSIFFNNELIEHVQAYVDSCFEEQREARERSKDAVILVEERLDFSHVVPQGFGTGDQCTVSDELATVRDLKYGKGKRVSAQKSGQMRLYGAGLIRMFSHLFNIKRIRLSIFQPRLDNYDFEEIEVAELIDWCESYVRPRALLAWKGLGEYNPGDHCTFCRNRFDCKARAEAHIDTAERMFGQQINTLTAAEIAEVLPKLKEWQAWASNMEDHALTLAARGSHIPGYKLVVGRSNRFFRDDDQDEIVSRLHRAEYAPDKFYTQPQPELHTAAQIEKQLGKKTFDELLGDLVVKPEGKPVLVPETDKRAPIANAPEDFFN